MILVGKRRAQQAPSHQQMPALGCPSLLREPSILPMDSPALDAMVTAIVECEISHQKFPYESQRIGIFVTFAF